MTNYYRRSLSTEKPPSLSPTPLNSLLLSRFGSFLLYGPYYQNNDSASVFIENDGMYFRWSFIIQIIRFQHHDQLFWIKEIVRSKNVLKKYQLKNSRFKKNSWYKEANFFKNCIPLSNDFCSLRTQNICEFKQSSKVKIFFWNTEKSTIGSS